MNSMEIQVLTEPEIADFLDIVQHERSEADWYRLAGFMHDMANGERTIWTARQNGAYCGFVTLRWLSDYTGFRHSPVAPEIIDLYVWQNSRRQGIATALLHTVENAAQSKGFQRIGLGVGILPADAAAWPLYLNSGYQFDGTGAWWSGQPVTETLQIDSNRAPVLLMMSKDL